MRRRYKRKKRISSQILIGICFLFLFVMGNIYANVSQTFSVSGSVRIKNNINNGVVVTIENEEVLEEGATRIRYNYAYTITNNTDQTLVNWKVLISNMPTTTTEIAEWNHTIYENDIANGRVIFQGAAWNVNIEAGQTLTVKFSFIAEELIDVNQLKISLYSGSSIPEEDPDEPVEPDEPIEPDPEEPEEEKLISLAISPSSAAMEIGETINLTVEKNPTSATDTLTWSSDNTQVATVSQDGTVTAISDGNCNIRVTNGEISATCTITVNKKEEGVNPPVSADGIEIAFSVNTAYGNSIQYKIVITNNSDNEISSCSFNLGMPENSTYTIWSIASATGNTITCPNKIAVGGTYEIYGQVDLPEGYNTSDYLNPTISGIQVQ